MKRSSAALSPGFLSGWFWMASRLYAFLMSRITSYNVCYTKLLRHSPGLEAFGDFSEPSGFAAMNELLDRDGSIDAVFCAGDMMAIGAMRALAARGRRVPDDVAVVGYDDLFVSSYTTPSLTTISQHIADTGRTLASRLVASIERGVVEGAVVPVELIKRDSA